MFFNVMNFIFFDTWLFHLKQIDISFYLLCRFTFIANACHFVSENPFEILIIILIWIIAVVRLELLRYYFIFQILLVLQNFELLQECFSFFFDVTLLNFLKHNFLALLIGVFNAGDNHFHSFCREILNISNLLLDTDSFTEFL